MKKLCLIIPSLQAGGMERVMTELACYFARKKEIELHMILYGITRQIFYPLPKNVLLHKPSFKFKNNRRLISSLKTLYYLRNQTRRINPDAVLSFGEIWNSFVLIALYQLKYPVYVSDRCQPNKSLGTLQDYLRKLFYSQAKGIIAQTQTAKEIYFSQLKHENIIVIGNPIRKILSNNCVKKENIVLTVGRLIESKNHDKLIEIFIKISKPGWKLVIIGYDHLKQNISEKLYSIIAANHAGQNVIIEGKQKNVESFYQKSKIFAFTSSSEGFPNAIGEAMSAGLPIISFDCIAGPSEMITNNKNGFLIPLFDYAAFERKLSYLMDNEELRVSFGEQARKDIMSKFSVETIGEKYFKLFFNH